jgi:hypothetical protein
MKRPRLRLCLTLLACGAVFASPVAATAAAHRGRSAHGPSRLIVINKGFLVNDTIGLIRLGMTPEQVTRRLGEPSGTGHLHGKISRQQFNRYKLEVDYDTKRDGDPATTILSPALPGSGWHTATGIRGGSTLEALRRAYGRRLARAAGYGPNYLFLWQGKPDRWKVFTVFLIFHGKVWSIQIISDKGVG